MMENSPQKLFPYALSSNVARVHAQPIEGVRETRNTGHWIMIACCIPMVGGAGLLLWAMGPDANWAERLGALVPIGICLGAHLVMHKIIGRTCHGQHSQKGQDQK
ncbi:MAG: hypothetical protein R3D65_06245 [Zhengella sp.]|uniref:hypothetical protein n=1 Tax=Hyphomicrobiales TaxID=356 RepID=UPI00096B99CB|nr:hypothetical protein [Salaquimonas pukyongi]